ncbi:MAG TPA: RNA polymerase sigma-70 factor [Ktedonobacteraceae bacterium]|nr:RNA polymerase sigma-70 factor [Ktedonobacteraceae bacterium]
MVESFESYRSYLFAIAYRMLGSAMDAEDMVQETYLRYQGTPPETIHSLKAFLTTIITRLCMDQLQLARRKRELYVGPWLPEPVLTSIPAEATDPQERVDTEESISLAFLLLLEKLQPFERAVFLLREVFEYGFAEIASILGKSEAACRRSFSRAKQRLSQHRPRFSSSPQAHRQLLSSYMQAVQTGEMSALEHVLAEDVTLWADAGGKVKQAALRPISGRDAVARFSIGTRRFLPETYQVEIAEINGQPAVVFRSDGKAFLVLAIEVEGGRIQTVRLMANPEKLLHI